MHHPALVSFARREIFDEPSNHWNRGLRAVDAQDPNLPRASRSTRARRAARAIFIADPSARARRAVAHRRRWRRRLRRLRRLRFARLRVARRFARVLARAVLPVAAPSLDFRRFRRFASRRPRRGARARARQAATRPRATTTTATATAMADDAVDAVANPASAMRALGVDDAARALSQGAEARVFALEFCGRDAICKQRFAKKYRLPALDERLTRARLVGEARAIVRARKLGVRAPMVLHVDANEACVYMERVAGVALKEALRRETCTREDIARYGREIGEAISKLHDGGLVHGDLTTSNFMVRDDDDAVVVIDFGLSYPSAVPEDKGVDLYVLERAINAAHPSQTELFDEIIATYKKTSKMWCATLNRFAEVRARGRKRSMVG